MGPKVDAACRFVDATGKRAFIGRLYDAVGLISGTSGTVVEPAPEQTPSGRVSVGP
jgi:carbamate kinase